MSVPRPKFQAILLLIVCVFAPALSGCGGPTAEDYSPPAETARQGLEAALTSWKNREPLKTITSLDTPVNVVDSRWRSGRRLQSFEIVAETPGDPHPTFTVKMQLAGQKAMEETKYIVTGLNPLIVFREEDYNVGGM